MMTYFSDTSESYLTFKIFESYFINSFTNILSPLNFVIFTEARIFHIIHLESRNKNLKISTNKQKLLTSSKIKTQRAIARPDYVQWRRK